MSQSLVSHSETPTTELTVPHSLTFYSGLLSSVRLDSLHLLLSFGRSSYFTMFFRSFHFLPIRLSSCWRRPIPIATNCDTQKLLRPRSLSLSLRRKRIGMMRTARMTVRRRTRRTNSWRRTAASLPPWPPTRSTRRRPSRRSIGASSSTAFQGGPTCGWEVPSSWVGVRSLHYPLARGSGRWSARPSA